VKVEANEAGFVATVEAEILAALATGPLPVHAIAERAGRPAALVLAVLRVMRHGGRVVDGPAADHTFQWSLAR
jgi:hypothetical protein